MGAAGTGAELEHDPVSVSAEPACEPHHRAHGLITNPPRPARLSLDLREFWNIVSITEPAKFLINALRDFRLPQISLLEGAASKGFSAPESFRAQRWGPPQSYIWVFSIHHFPAFWFGLTQVQITPVLTNVNFCVHRSSSCKES